MYALNNIIPVTWIVQFYWVCTTGFIETFWHQSLFNLWFFACIKGPLVCISHHILYFICNIYVSWWMHTQKICVFVCDFGVRECKSESTWKGENLFCLYRRSCSIFIYRKYLQVIAWSRSRHSYCIRWLCIQLIWPFIRYFCFTYLFDAAE